MKDGHGVLPEMLVQLSHDQRCPNAMRARRPTSKSCTHCGAASLRQVGGYFGCGWAAAAALERSIPWLDDPAPDSL
eukprot:1159324-Pelagomonas_calceolata.AAC.4